MTRKTGTAGATQLLAAMMAYGQIDPEGGMGADEIEELPGGGLRAVLHLASGDRFRVTVDYLGDREADAPAAS